MSHVDKDVLKNLILNDMAIAEKEGKDLHGYSVALFHLKTMPEVDIDGYYDVVVEHRNQCMKAYAREILGNLSSHTSIGIRHLKELMAECDNAENKAWLEGKISELCNLEKIISEFEKKYIGE